MVRIGDDYVLLCCMREPRFRGIAGFLAELRSLNEHIAVQAVNADLVAGKEHAIGILQQSMESRKRGILSKRIEIDVLLRLACTDQIDRALDSIGVKESTSNVLIIAIGKQKNLQALREHLQSNYNVQRKIPTPSKRQLKIISELRGVTQKELGVAGEGNKLARILIEHASLL
jgi:tRNA threonylcarbamoyladenosine modification (KEOPS) complex Cgi121 subunit